MICENEFHERLSLASDRGVSDLDISEKIGVHPQRIAMWKRKESAPPAFSREIIILQIEIISPKNTPKGNCNLDSRDLLHSLVG